MPETIEAFEIVGAKETAELLMQIQEIMAKHGVTTQRLREDFANTEELQITSFRELHGEELTPMTQEIGREAEKIYVYAKDGEDVFSRFKRYWRIAVMNL